MISGWVTYLYGKTTTPAFKTAGSVEDFTLQLLEVYTGFFGGSTERAIALLAATITGLLLSLKRNSLWGIFPITVFCGEILLNFFHLFPLTGSRYCTWIFLPIGMCISYLAYHVSERFSKGGQQILAPTPDLRPLIGQFKVESATPFSVGQRPPSRPAVVASLRSVRPRRGGP